MKTILKAAEALLEARKNEMLTMQEWADLAKAVAAFHGQPTADYLSERDIEMLEAAHIDWDWEVDRR